MLYLNLALTLARKHFISSLSFVLSSLLIFTLSVQHQFVDEILGKKIESPKSFFHALVSGSENHQRLARKLRELPGVESVNIVNEKDLKAEWKSVMASWNIGDLDKYTDFIDDHYAGLKVIFKDALSARSESLVMEYVQRLVGKENVTLSSIKRPEAELFNVHKKTPIENPLNWVYAFLGFIWIGSLFSLSENLQRESYLIENFQRVDGVQLKSSLALLFTFLLPLIGLNFLWGNPSLLGGGIALTLVSIVFLVMGLRKWSWR